MLLGLYLGASFVCYKFIHPISIINPLKYVNVFSAFDSYSFWGEYTNVNLFGYPTNKLTCCFVVGGILCIIAVLISCAAFVKRPTSYISVIFSRIIAFFTNRKRKISGNTSLFSHELYKITFHNKAIFVVLALALIGYLSTDVTPFRLFPDDSAYKTYVDKYEGKITNSKIQEIEKDKIFFDNLPNESLKLMKSYENGDLTVEEFLRSSNKLSMTSGYLIGFNRFYEQYEYIKFLKTEQNIEGSLICSLSTDEIFSNYNEKIMIFLLYVIALIICLSGVFSGDIKKGIFNIVRTTKYGKSKLFFTKHLVGAVVSFILLVIIYAPSIMTFAAKYNIADYFAPIQSIAICKNVTMQISIIGFISLASIVMVLGGMCISTAIIFVSLSTKNNCRLLLFHALLVYYQSLE